MKRLTLISFILAVVLSGLSGCIIVADDPPYYESYMYEYCDYGSDCEPAADNCFDITVSYGRTDASSSMCSTYCDGDWDCYDGGACYDFWGPAICYQRCRFNSDCPGGWSCLDAADTYSFDRICLPG